jgi:hypothetical protein
MSTIYSVIKRPVITEKGLTLKENERTLCLKSTTTPANSKFRKLSSALQSEGPTSTNDGRSGQDAAARQIQRRAPLGLEESVRHASMKAKR